MVSGSVLTFLFPRTGPHSSREMSQLTELNGGLYWTDGSGATVRRHPPIATHFSTVCNTRGVLHDTAIISANPLFFDLFFDL